MNFAKFSGLGLAEPLCRALSNAGYAAPTPIQARAIPPLLAGRDAIGIAQTGTGKTAAFALPLLQRLAGLDRAKPHLPCAVVLAPTRELAIQIGRAFDSYGRGLRLRHVLVYGGVGQQPQTQALAHGVDIVVATPGRLLDLLEQRKLRLDQVSILVLDEADRMLDMGFIRDVRRIVAATPKTRQSLLFSATMPPDIARLAAEILRDPVRIDITPARDADASIDQRVFFVNATDKPSVLVRLLADPALSRVLAFTRTKHGANRLATQLGRAGIGAEAIHGNKSQGARVRALEAFRAGRARVLVATDIAARGIDIAGITHVVNFDLPQTAEAYVHRIGRTARAGAAGVAISLCVPQERTQLRDIEKLTRQRIAVAEAALVRASRPAAVETGIAPSIATVAPDRGRGSPKRSGRPGTVTGRAPNAIAAAPTGVVKSFDEDKGFGFIRPDGGGKDVFLHVTALSRSGLGRPAHGQKVSCELARDRRGRLSATNLRSF